MKKIISLVILCSLLIVYPAAAQTEYPELSGALGGEFDGEGIHLYVFTGNAGDNVAVRMTSNDLDPALLIVSESGELVGWDDDSAGDFNAQVNVQLPDTGLYMVLATTFRNLYLDEELEGRYEIAIQGNSANANLLEEAELADFALDAVASPQLNSSTPFYLATIAVQDSITVTIDAVSNTVDTLLYVFDPEGRLLILDDDSGSVEYSASLPNLVLDEPGDYLVLLSSRDYLDSLTGDIESGEVQFSIIRS